MKRPSHIPLLTAALIALSGPAWAATPTADTVVERAISAAELESTLAGHDMIRIAVRQEETAADGSATTRDVTAVVHGARLENIRLELGQGTSLVLNNSTAWAMMRGQLDTRVQTPRMAAGTIRQTMFPLLMPYSLRMEGVRLGAVTEGSFDATPAWVVQVDFDADFFAAPTMIATWNVYIGRADNVVLGAEFLPPKEFHAVLEEGVRYRFLKWQELDGLKIAAQVLLDGIDLNGAENGHVRVTKMTSTNAGPLDLSLFLHPDEQERLDAGDVF